MMEGTPPQQGPGVGDERKCLQREENRKISGEKKPDAQERTKQASLYSRISQRRECMETYS